MTTRRNEIYCRPGATQSWKPVDAGADRAFGRRHICRDLPFWAKLPGSFGLSRPETLGAALCCHVTETQMLRCGPSFLPFAAHAK